MSHFTSQSSMTFAAFIGLDRSDAKLDICLQVPGAEQPEHSTIDNTPEQIAPWIEALRRRFSAAQGHKEFKVALCLEQPAGALLYRFLSCEWVVVYAVNPVSLARHRETLVTSRAKSDATDACLNLSDHYGQVNKGQPIP